MGEGVSSEDPSMLKIKNYDFYFIGTVRKVITLRDCLRLRMRTSRCLASSAAPGSARRWSLFFQLSLLVVRVVVIRVSEMWFVLQNRYC